MAKRKYPINIKEARDLVTASGILIEDGHVYHLYTCGHIIDSVDDVSRSSYSTKTKSSTRSCPLCEVAKPLIVKYKLCGCGAEQIGYAQQPSEFCKHCSHARKNEFQTIPIAAGHANEKDADPDRWDCEFRDGCLEKYYKYQAIPCKNCVDYVVSSGNVDAVYERSGEI